MKKHDEGYALVFVLVVMAVLGIVATTLMTGAMKNLQAQNTSLFQMQDKYEAAGKIEKFVAKIEDETPYNAAEPKGKLDDAQRMIVQNLEGYAGNGNNYNGIGIEFVSFTWSDDYSCVVKLIAEPDADEEEDEALVRIVCELALVNIIKSQDGKFYGDKPTIDYKSYTVEYLTPPTTEGGASE